MGSYEQPGFSLGYIDPTDMDAKNMQQFMDHFYQQNYTAGSVNWLQGAIDNRFKVGDQSIYNLAAGNNLSQNYQKFFFNFIRRNINMVCGFQRRNRRSTVALPISFGDDPLADDWNKVIRWSEDRDNYQEYHSQAFEGSVTTGMTLEFMYPDYANDPISGDLFTDSVSYNNFLIDQFFRKRDLSDCNGVWRRRWTTKEGAMLLLPGYAKEIKKMRLGTSKDGRFPVQAELQNVAISDLMTMDEFHYRTTREATLIIDPKSGESVEWEQDEDDPEDMMERTLAMQPWLVVKKTQIPTVKLAIALAGKIVYNGPNLLDIDTYPCVPSICFYDPDVQHYAWRCMGLVRSQRDPQFLFNLRKIIELQMLQTQITSGWIYPVDLLPDVKALRQTGEGFHIPIKAGRSVEELKRIDPPVIPPSLLELSKGLQEDINKVVGINEELLGSAVDDKAAVLAMLRQGAGLTTLQTIFDNADNTQRLYGKIRMQAIRKKFSKGKIRNILGHDPDPRFFSTYSLKYSLGVEEGNYSTTQRQMELQQLLQFREAGIPIPNKSILDAAFIVNKKQVIEDMQQEQEAQAQQTQMQNEAAAKESEAKTINMMAKTRLDHAAAQEKLANIKKIDAQSEHEKMKADYELVEIMMTLEDKQFNQIKSSFELAQAIKMANEPQQSNLQPA